MTLLDDLRSFITRLSPEPVCDDCITQRLGHADPEQVAQATRELSGNGGFERRRDAWGLCGVEKLVVRRR